MEKYKNKYRIPSTRANGGITAGMVRILLPFAPKTENIFLAKSSTEKWNYRTSALLRIFYGTKSPIIPPISNWAILW